MRILKLNAPSGECTLALGESIERLPSYYSAEKVVIVTDSNVHRLHGHHFPKNADVIEIGQGEEAKTLDSVRALYERFLETELDRSSLVIGIGGGIVCDVTGFAASTYLRGVPFGFVPTTLLAQVDASIGGKNGVNLHGYKNLIGTIRQPRFCLMDFELLKTLPARELRNGLAEILKCGAIRDAALFTYLEQHLSDVLKLKRPALEKAVYDAVQVKAAIVSRDESERGERMLLNFGHTLGHAVEKIDGVSHGEAIAIGMCIASNLSVARGLLSSKSAGRLERLLVAAGLPIERKAPASELLDAIRKDKKRRGEDIHLALLQDLGNAVVQKMRLEEIALVLNSGAGVP